MKKYLLHLALLTNIFVYAQPSIQWQKSIGGLGYDSCRNILQTSDGGYITIGTSNSNDGDISGNHGSYDIVVVKLTNTGSIEWQKSYGGSNSDSAGTIKNTADGGYIIAGTTSSNDGDVSGNHGFSDYWVVKITNVGVIEWQKCLGGTNGESANDIEQTSDGGYIVAGSSSSVNGDVTGNHNPVGSSGNSDYWIVKLTNTGNITWQKCLGSDSTDYCFSIKQTIDGGYIVNGDIQANSGDVTGHHGDFDYWVVKLNATGQIEWQKALGGTSWDTGVGVIQNTDGDYLVAGYSSSNNGDISDVHGGGDAWVVKLGAAGNIIWQKALGGTKSDFLYSIRQTIDGGYILCGDSTSDDGQATGHHGSADTFDYWAIKLSGNGVVEWHKSLGGSDDDTAVSLIEVSNGNYLISGYSSSNDGDITSSHGLRDGWIAYLSSNLAVSENRMDTLFDVYPNPTTNVINVNIDARIIGTSYTLYDQSSRVMKTGVLHDLHSMIQIEDLSMGLYILDINNSGIKIIKN